MAEAQAGHRLRETSLLPILFCRRRRADPLWRAPGGVPGDACQLTIVMKASYEMALFLGGQVGTHEPIVMVW